jgi:ATP-dependent exoDNAse (exonuclease V) alpha subunit
MLMLARPSPGAGRGGHRDLVTVVGHSATIAAGEWITATGEWVNDRNHGQQFKARFLRTSAPTSTEGIEKCLSSGMIRGIGPVYARKLVRAFAERVFDVIEAEPDEAAVTRIIELVKTLIPCRFGLDSTRDIQVLCPKKLVVLVGQKKAVAIAVRNVSGRRRHGGAGEIGRRPELGLGRRQVDPQVRTQPALHPVGEQPANVVHVQPAGSPGTPPLPQRR